MDNERDAIERDVLEEKLVKLVSELPLDLTDPNDKQWFIECCTLRAAELNAEADLFEAKTAHLKAETAKIEAETNLLVLKASQPQRDEEYETVIEATCGYCDSKFIFKGNEDAADTAYERFCDIHDPCGRR